MKLKTLVAALAIGLSAAASAQNAGPIKIGIITDMSSLYADIDRLGDVTGLIAQLHAIIEKQPSGRALSKRISGAQH